MGCTDKAPRTRANVRSIKGSRWKGATGLWKSSALIATAFVHVSQRRRNNGKVDATRKEPPLRHRREHEFATICRPLVYGCASVCVSQTHTCTFARKKVLQEKFQPENYILFQQCQTHLVQTWALRLKQTTTNLTSLISHFSDASSWIKIGGSSFFWCINNIKSDVKAVSAAVTWWRSAKLVSFSAVSGFPLEKRGQQELQSEEERGHSGGRNAARLTSQPSDLNQSELLY